MKLERLSATAELVSSVAIVVTLVYLTMEVRQNTEAQHAQSRQSILSSSQAELFVLMDHPDVLRGLFGEDSLTDEQSIRIDAWLSGVLRAREFSWLQYRRGIMDESQWSTELAVTLSVMSPGRSRLWWDRAGRTYVGPEFAQFLDDLLATEPTAEAQLDWWVP